MPPNKQQHTLQSSRLGLSHNIYTYYLQDIQSSERCLHIHIDHVLQQVLGSFLIHALSLLGSFRRNLSSAGSPFSGVPVRVVWIAAPMQASRVIRTPPPRTARLLFHLSIRRDANCRLFSLEQIPASRVLHLTQKDRPLLHGLRTSMSQSR